MTRTIRRLRATGRAVLVELGAAVGTFVGLAWAASNAAMAIDGEFGGSIGERSAPVVPEVAVWAGVFGVAVGGTLWLERGGYRRLGANATGGIDFAWLSVVALPATFLPGAYALSLLVDPPAGAANLYPLGCALVGARLAFYGGLERLRLDRIGLGRPGVAVAVAALAVVAVAALAPVAAVIDALGAARVTEASLRVAVACLGQVLVLRLGAGEGIAVVPNWLIRRA